MKIGYMGLGKLGLPEALAVEAVGHEVMGYDPGPQVVEILKTRKLPYNEVGAQALLENTRLRLVGPADLVNECDLIFIAVQTPHQPKYEGITRLPSKRVDFDYTYLKDAVSQLSQALASPNTQKTTARVVIISTVLPGTVDREIRPLMHPGMKLCYNPHFIAMGTTIPDFTNPEFVLFGVDDPETAEVAEQFYKTIHNKPFYRTAIKNAELIKVAYNTFISTKLAFVNTLMEVCHKTGCDVDAVTDGLKMASDRLISTKYLTAGMGDGGGCHPRDNIALSWLARKLEMGFDFFEAIMMSREKQTDWFADVIEEQIEQLAQTRLWRNIPVIILGEAFKPETNLVTGSPARLLQSVLRERGIFATTIDPVVRPKDPHIFPSPAIFFVGTRHSVFTTMKFERGSIVIDPHRFMPDQEGVTVIRLGQSS